MYPVQDLQDTCTRNQCQKNESIYGMAPVSEACVMRITSGIDCGEKAQPEDWSFKWDF